MIEAVIEKLKEKYKGFEEREEQTEMWMKTYESMKNGKKAAIHAPTGTGKSLGYLLPAIAMKLKDPEFRMTVSTFTLNLQDQLENDLEIVKEIYKELSGKELNAIVMKGQKNYLCEARFDKADVDDELKNRIKKKLHRGFEGEKNKIEEDVSFKEWSELSVEYCDKEKCPLAKDCTFANVSRQVKKADILITNHTLWMVRNFKVEKLSKDFDFFVFDEAHKLEKNMLDVHTHTISTKMIEKWIQQGEKVGKEHGLDQIQIDEWAAFIQTSDELMEWKQFDNRMNSALRTESDFIDDVGIPIADVKEAVNKVQNLQKKMFESMIEEIGDEWDEESPTLNVKIWMSMLLELREFISVLKEKKEIGKVWLERKNEDAIDLKITPRSLKMIESPFNETGVLFTSGTIAVNGTCGDIANRLNVKLDHDLALTSPFNLEKNTLVHVASHINPKEKNVSEKWAEETLDLIKRGEQKTFVLFTSKKAMWTVYKMLLDDLRAMKTYKNQSIDIFIQQDGNNRKIMKSFKDENRRSVLFGTMKYFEGVDLKGNTLNQVILTRLPYSVPTHPIQRILNEEKGYSTWEASIKMEQAFGRLIRTQNDYGTFHILDNRVSYLKHFMTHFKKNGIREVKEKTEIDDFFVEKNE